MLQEGVKKIMKEVITMAKKETKKEFFRGLMERHNLSDYERERIENEIALLERKNGSEKKPSKTQLENEKIKISLLETMKPNVFYTATDLCKLMGIESNQKMTHIVTPLVETGKLVRKVDKRRAYFSLP